MFGRLPAEQQKECADERKTRLYISRFRFAVSPDGRRSGGVPDRWKVIAIDDFTKPVEAYDLVADPGETNNLVRAGAPLPKEAEDLVPYLKPIEKQFNAK